ncbi:hypothetical protein [Saccharopolyspora taberi]|uniref:Uncharacterized protein n=1 Tax=Saccharopolyspora taberi TaxID=60895 RepID=A0ABN3V9Q7_9PSEU
MDGSHVTFEDVARSLGETWTFIPWELKNLDYRDGVYRGLYHVQLDADLDEKAPHRPLLHGSTLFEISMYHTLASALFAYSQEHFPELSSAPKVSLAEAGRRFLITSVKLKFRKPIFDPEVTVDLTSDRIVGNFTKRGLVFFYATVRLAGGKHVSTIGGCFNLRDDLMATATA